MLGKIVPACGQIIYRVSADYATEFCGGLGLRVAICHSGIVVAKYGQNRHAKIACNSRNRWNVIGKIVHARGQEGQRASLAYATGFCGGLGLRMAICHSGIIIAKMVPNLETDLCDIFVQDKGLHFCFHGRQGIAQGKLTSAHLVCIRKL